MPAFFFLLRGSILTTLCGSPKSSPTLWLPILLRKPSSATARTLSLAVTSFNAALPALVSGFAPYVIGTIPLGPVELFGKVGYYFYDVDASVDLDDGPDFDSTSSEQDLLYGFGVGMTFFERLNARLVYEKIDSGRIDDADALWFSGQWRF